VLRDGGSAHRCGRVRVLGHGNRACHQCHRVSLDRRQPDHGRHQNVLSVGAHMVRLDDRRSSRWLEELLKCLPDARLACARCLRQVQRRGALSSAVHAARLWALCSCGTALITSSTLAVGPRWAAPAGPPGSPRRTAGLRVGQQGSSVGREVRALQCLRDPLPVFGRHGQRVPAPRHGETSRTAARSRTGDARAADQPDPGSGTRRRRRSVYGHRRWGVDDERDGAAEDAVTCYSRPLLPASIRVWMSSGTAPATLSMSWPVVASSTSSRTTRAR
jgi:hypothetical protein